MSIGLTNQIIQNKRVINTINKTVLNWLLIGEKSLFQPQKDCLVFPNSQSGSSLNLLQTFIYRNYSRVQRFLTADSNKIFSRLKTATSDRESLT